MLAQKFKRLTGDDAEIFQQVKPLKNAVQEVTEPENKEPGQQRNVIGGIKPLHTEAEEGGDKVCIQKTRQIEEMYTADADIPLGDISRKNKEKDAHRGAYKGGDPAEKSVKRDS